MLLLHVCCADCVIKFIQALGDDGQLLLYFYNPNIHPRSEYLARLNALKRVIKDKDFKLDLVIPDYRPRDYFQALKRQGAVGHPLPGERCSACWRLRLEASFEYARDHGLDEVSTTLLSSHYQQREAIIKIGNELAEKYQIEFVALDQIDCQLKTAGFYKQNFCGCCYSLLERMEQNYT